MSMQLLKQPLSADEIRKQMEQDSRVSGIIEISMHDILNTDMEEFLDTLSIHLIGSELLMNTDYDIVGHLNNTLYMHVTGDASMAIDAQ